MKQTLVNRTDIVDSAIPTVKAGTVICIIEWADDIPANLMSEQFLRSGLSNGLLADADAFPQPTPDTPAQTPSKKQAEKARKSPKPKE